MVERTPQLEDGYTRINNPTLEALISYQCIPAYVRIQLYVMRMTWGYGRKTTILRNRDFVTACKITHKNVGRTIKKAINAKLINTFTAEGIQGTRYGINKLFKQWQMPSARKIPSAVKKNTFTAEGTHLYKRKDKKKNKTYNTEEWEFKKKVSLPKGFHLSDRMRTYALEKGIDENRIDDVFNYFCDFHLSKGNTFKNWTRAWYTWVRNDIKFNKGPEDGFDEVRRQLEKAGSAPSVGEVSEQDTSKGSPFDLP